MRESLREAAEAAGLGWRDLGRVSVGALLFSFLAAATSEAGPWPIAAFMAMLATYNLGCLVLMVADRRHNAAAWVLTRVSASWSAETRYYRALAETITERVREAHPRAVAPAVRGGEYDVCGTCDQAWPCETLTILGER